MGKISKFLAFFGDEFLSRLFGFIAVMAVSVGLQSLLFHFCNQYLAVDDYVLITNAGIFAIMLFWSVATLITGRENVFPLKGTVIGGLMCAFVILLTVSGVYVLVICPQFHRWELLILALVILLLCWAALEVIFVDTHILGLIIGADLCYILGTYFAMLINDLQPAVEFTEAVFIVIATLTVWFRAVFEQKSPQKTSPN